MNRAILGIDEVGRGPFAGPLVIGACILPEDAEKYEWYYDLTDSKKCSRNKRERLYFELEEYATFATGWVSAKEINKIGLNEALRLATRRAVEKIQKEKVPFTEIIIDGNENFLEGTPLEKYTTTMIKGDFYVKEISAASIVAKVEHDHYMFELDEKYPDYGFENHVGYGTPQHLEAIREYGIIEDEHRVFIKKVRELAGIGEYSEKNLSKHKKNTTLIGKKAEDIIASYLMNVMDHEIIARNYKTHGYEIDIVSIKDYTIYFTEVKYRKNSNYGSPEEAVGAKKYRQMTYAAEAYMHSHRKMYKNYDYELAVGTIIGENFDFDDWFVLF